MQFRVWRLELGPAFAHGPFGETHSEHWGVITRNTIGSPVASLRDGPYGSFGVTGDAAEPPFGKGSLGIEVGVFGTTAEKVDFGNEVDFFGDPVLALSAVGFRVFQTGENAGINARNMPNIRFEIDANLNALPADNYTTMVWVPDAAPVTDRWSGYIDATTTGNWYFTGAEGTATGCDGFFPFYLPPGKAPLGGGGAGRLFFFFSRAEGPATPLVCPLRGFWIKKHFLLLRGGGGLAGAPRALLYFFSKSPEGGRASSAPRARPTRLNPQRSRNNVTGEPATGLGPVIVIPVSG